MADSSKLRAASSFASDATVSRGINEYSPSPLSQKPAYPPSYDEKPESNDATDTSFSTLLRKFKTVFLTLLKKYWFLVGLAFVITIAWAAPNVARKGGYIRAEWSIKWGAVIIIFLISGLSLRTKILTQTFMRIRLHLLVQIINLVIIPFFVFGVVLLFFKLHASMNSLVLIGLVIAASTPTTVSSNVVMTKTAKGNEATALMNAAVGNVLGIFVSPALVDTFQEPLIDATPEHEAAHSGGTVDFITVLKQLGLTVLLPLVIGQIIQLIFTEQVAKIKVKWRLSDVSSVCLLCMVWSVFCDAFYNESFSAVSATDIVAVAILNAAFYVLFSLLCFFLAYLPFPSSVKEPAWLARLRYSREDTVAVMYCGATKTVAMGVPLINVLYQHGDPGTVGVLSTPLLLYHVEQLILGNVEVDILKKWVLSGREKESDTPPPRDIEDRMPPDSGMSSRVPQNSTLDGPPTSPVDTIEVKQYFADNKSETVKTLPSKYPEPVNKPGEQADTKEKEYQEQTKHETVHQPKHEVKSISGEETAVSIKQQDTSRRSSRATDDKSTQKEEQREQEESSTEMTPTTEKAPPSKGLKIETSTQERTAPEHEQSRQSPMDDLLNSPLFTSDTATISLDTSRFSLDSVYNPPSPPPPIPTKRYPF